MHGHAPFNHAYVAYEHQPLSHLELQLVITMCSSNFIGDPRPGPRKSKGQGWSSIWTALPFWTARAHGSWVPVEPMAFGLLLFLLFLLLRGLHGWERPLTQSSWPSESLQKEPSGV